MTEEILIDIKLDDADNEKQVENLTKRITVLHAETKELVRQNKELAASGKTNSSEFIENAKQVEINKQKISENTASRKGLIQAIIAEDGSIKQLKVRNAELIKQRDLITTKTKEGREAIARINSEINENNDVIKENVSQQEKQRLNVGNYASALDKLVPGLGNVTVKLYEMAAAEGSVAAGLRVMIKESLAFIATPLGLTLTAIGLALAPVITYLKKTGDGMDIVDVETAKWNATLEVLTLRIADLGREMVAVANGTSDSQLGKFLLHFVASNPIVAQFGLTIKALAKLFPELAKDIETARKVAAENANTLDDLNDKQLLQSINAAKTRNEIAKLILQSKDRTKTEQERIALIDQAIQKESDLVEEEKYFADQRLAAKIKEVTDLHKLDTDDTETRLAQAERLAKALQNVDDKRSEELVNLINSVQEAEGASIGILEKLQNQRNAILDKQEEENKKRLDAELEGRIKKLHEAHEEQLYEEERNKEVTDELRAADEQQYAENWDKKLETLAEAHRKSVEDELNKNADLAGVYLEDYEIYKKNLEKKLKDELILAQRIKGLKESELDTAAAVAEGIAANFSKVSNAQKTATLASIVFSTASGVAKAVEAGAGIPWPANLAAILSGVAAVLGGIAQARAVLKGYAQGGLVMAKEAWESIKGFARGGSVSGQKIGAQHGTPITRSNGDNRVITAKIGEVILNEQQQAALGGSETFRKIGVPGFANGGQVLPVQSFAESMATRTAMNRINSTPAQQTKYIPVLVYQDFEMKAAEVSSPVTRAKVI